MSAVARRICPVAASLLCHHIDIITLTSVKGLSPEAFKNEVLLQPREDSDETGLDYE